MTSQLLILKTLSTQRPMRKLLPRFDSIFTLNHKASHSSWDYFLTCLTVWFIRSKTIAELVKVAIFHLILHFTAYGVCQKFVATTFENKTNISEISTLGNATAGFLAAFFSSLTLCPTELIKCKLQALHEMKQTTRVTAFQLTKQILQTEGIKGMFRGLTPTFAREMPGYFFFFGGYEFTREFLAKWVDRNRLSFQSFYLLETLSSIIKFSAD